MALSRGVVLCLPRVQLKADGAITSLVAIEGREGKRVREGKGKVKHTRGREEAFSNITFY